MERGVVLTAGGSRRGSIDKPRRTAPRRCCGLGGCWARVSLPPDEQTPRRRRSRPSRHNARSCECCVTSSTVVHTWSPPSRHYAPTSGPGDGARNGPKCPPISSIKRSMPKLCSGFDRCRLDPDRHARQPGHAGQPFQVVGRAGHQPVHVRPACGVRQPPLPLWPQPCGTAITPATMSLVAATGNSIAPCGELTRTRSPSAMCRSAAPSTCIRPCWRVASLARGTPPLRTPNAEKLA